MIEAPLLPPAPTDLESALANAGSAAAALPILARYLKDPARVPDSALAHLAWELSVDIWDDAWPDAVKRDVVLRAFRLHAIKGTLEGIREHVRLTGASVTAWRLPPDCFFPEPALTRAERIAMLAGCRQVRIYPIAERAPGNFATYLGHAYGLTRLFAGFAYPIHNGASMRIGARTTLYDPKTKTETPIPRVVIQAVDRPPWDPGSGAIETVFLPATAGPRLFPARRPLAVVFAGSSEDVEKRVYNLSIDRDTAGEEDGLHPFAARPLGRAVNVVPTRVRQRATRGFGSLFPRLFTHGREFVAPGLVFLPPSQAARRIYDVVYLDDGVTLRRRKVTRAFAGFLRLGMPPYHAQLMVSAPARRPRLQFGRFAIGFVVDPSHERVEKARQAIITAKAARDRVWMTTRTKRPLTVGSAAVHPNTRVGTWLSVR